MDTLQLSSIAAVIGLTCILVQLIKRSTFMSWSVLKNVPLIVVAVLIAVGLTLTAHGAGYLQGNILQLVFRAILAALSSSGLYSAVTGSSLQSFSDVTTTAPPSDPSPPSGRPYLFAIGVGLAISNVAGCAMTTRLTDGLGITHSTGVVLSPAQRLYNAKLTYGALLNELADLRDQHVFTEEMNNDLKPYRYGLNSALRLWEVAIKTGDASAQTKQEALFNESLKIVQEAVQRLQPRVPSTQGVSHGNSVDASGLRRQGCGPRDEVC